METGEVLAPGVNAVHNVGEEDTLAHVLATILHLWAQVHRALVTQLKLATVTLITVQVSVIPGKVPC